jgi:flagellin-like hook-associated protein FlgL
MRITHRMIADTVNFNLQRSLNRLDKYSNQLSTGKVFQRPSENPVGVGRVMSYTSAVNRNEQFRLNMNQTSGWLDNTEFSLQNGLDALQRIRELSIYGANESLTAEDRRAIAPEVLEFINHLVGVANTETNGLYIFGGHQTLKVPFVRERAYHVKGNPESGIKNIQNEVQTVNLGGATGGTFTLTYGGQTTGDIAYNANATSGNPAEVTVESSLRALANIGSADVSVTGAAGGPFTVEFTGELAGTNVDQITINGSGLTGGSVEPLVATTTPGKSEVLVDNFQNGSYSLNQAAFTTTADTSGKTVVKESFLQGNAESIIGSAKWGPLVVDAGSNIEVGAGFISGSPTAAFSLELTFDGTNWTDQHGDPVDTSAGYYDGVTVDPSELSNAVADDVVTVTSVGDDISVNSSVLLEVTGVDSVTGRVDYIYTAHEYDMDGVYTKKTGDFFLEFGGVANSKTVDIGSVGLGVTGLNTMSKTMAGGLRVGDKTVLNLTPSTTAGPYERVTLSGEHRGGDSGMVYSFNPGNLDGSDIAPQDITLNYFSLDSFDRSPTKGKVYDGNIKLTYNDTFSDSEPALTFSYDSLGFPVYYGDNNDRIQEISPHQEMTMNLSGDKAFGENQQVFEAVIDVYWALMDNDREALGDSALAKMDDAVNHFLEKLAQVGARSNRVEAMHNTLFSENLYLREVRSNIEDIDLAYIISEFKMQESAYKAALSTASMMLQPSLVDYLR